MQDTTYKRLTNHLLNTRKYLWEACDDLGIDYDSLDLEQLNLEQCSGCNLWTRDLRLDLDHNPICRFCVDLVGL